VQNNYKFSDYSEEDYEKEVELMKLSADDTRAVEQ